MSFLEKSKAYTIIKKHPKKVIALIAILIGYYFCLPKTLFKDPTSTVIESKEGLLLGAKIASDGQWRFPEIDSIPFKFEKCLLYFEDQYFYKHPGFNPVAIIKAISQNIKAGQVVRGGSTLTQQVIRLSRKGKKRTYLEKIVELVKATRLELRHSKKSILKLYASHAPFGGNVVGLDMASWRYFGVQPHQLSWAESATLAVLPNAPSLIFPGKNQELLLAKRNRLLQKLLQENVIDTLTYNLAIAEALPQKPYRLPQTAPHLLERTAKEHKGKRIKTSIAISKQQQVNQIVKQHHEILQQNEINNAAVLVINVKTRKVIAYVGNTPTGKEHQKDVDIITAPRSTGSVLKPFLYAAMLDAGELLPNTLVADVPTQIAGYNPKNFDEQYDGAVTAKRALARSLNVPAVRLLQQYGLQRFREEIKGFNIKHINKSVDHYGLSLILGGAESSLWDVCKTYAAMASTVNHFNETSSEYFTDEFTEPILLENIQAGFGKKSNQKTIYNAASMYLTFNAMKEVNRPEGDESWEFYDSSKEIAWKTGTSFGNRDAWAVGVTPNYVVGVWVGNADGEGRPSLTGVSSAAPIMFDVFNVLPQTKWFSTPHDELVEVSVCKESGYLASSICPNTIMLVPENGKRFSVCKYHQLIHVNKQQLRVNSSCEDINNMQRISWFVLPPLMEYYYKNKNATYKVLPPFKEGCLTEVTPNMDFIFPKENGKVVLTKDFNGKTNPVVLKLAHSKPETTVFWYVNDTFIGKTQTFHEVAIQPKEGKHKITVLDELGNEIQRFIEIQNTQ
jgi:penicillin-binding protein 1C